eukprot:TRINITY_DN4914_c0_g1_i1.p1 TRINITY_DN4914_c0_g1~~TRINITY_DN4914_c0_g1_i1.p1  ORF type:complete len:232 (-),score=46.87 TRINITY_DN4914_c0_g1_i1:34-729(-)
MDKPLDWFHTHWTQHRDGKLTCYVPQYFHGLKSLNDKVFPLEYPDSFYTALNGRPNHFAIVCIREDEDEDEDTVIGGVSAYIDTWDFFVDMMFKKGNKKAVIATLGVSALYRRRGIARVLMMDMIGYLWRKGCNQFVLRVQCENRGAIEFYQSFGFVIEKRLVNYYMSLGSDAYEMLFVIPAYDTLENPVLDDHVFSRSQPVNIKTIAKEGGVNPWIVLATIIFLIYHNFC